MTRQIQQSIPSEITVIDFTNPILFTVLVLLLLLVLLKISFFIIDKQEVDGEYYGIMKKWIEEYPDLKRIINEKKSENGIITNKAYQNIKAVKHSLDKKTI